MNRIVLWLGVLVALAPTSIPGFADEAELRKARSIAILAAEGVPSIAHLPIIENESECRRRGKEEVVHRMFTLAIVAAKAETQDDDLVRNAIDRFAAHEFFTPKEQAYLDDPEPSDQARANFFWRNEAAFVMLWALGIVPELERPDKVCDSAFIAETLWDLGTDGLMRRAKLRPQAELLDADDLIYRYHWAVREATLRRLKPPAGLNEDVVMERHYALNWLIGLTEEDGEQNEEWDEISTST